MGQPFTATRADVPACKMRTQQQDGPKPTADMQGSIRAMAVEGLSMSRNSMTSGCSVFSRYPISSRWASTLSPIHRSGRKVMSGSFCWQLHKLQGDKALSALFSL